MSDNIQERCSYPQCAEILASHFKATRIFRLIDPESVRYRQVVVLATRRSRRERAVVFPEASQEILAACVG